jgi:erythronate-4-phosphate dehydrogenase
VQQDRVKIVADENIPFVREAFVTLGDVDVVSGRELAPSRVRDADVLLVRSVTRVDARLLAGSRVQFVASATIGVDHVDLAWLQAQGIGFANAPGCNAASAAEYVVSALLVLAQHGGFRLSGRRVGIIGCGNVGSRVLRMLTVLGMDCVVNDPPLRSRGGHDDFVELDEALAADIVTLHVPLQRGGEDPTLHLVDAAVLARLRPGTILLNTARGAVVDGAALEHRLAVRDDLQAVLDVWEREPAIDAALLERVALGTPHIAGYSLDGKLRGTEMVYTAVCRHFGVPARWSAARCLPSMARQPLVVPAGADPQDAVRAAVLAAYDVRRDDADLRRMLHHPAAERPAVFDRLRRDYPVRREFNRYTVRLHSAAREAAAQLTGLGFRVVEA